MNTQQIAEAFSGHRFAEVYPFLAPEVRWVVPGQVSMEGRAAVVAACEEALAGMQALRVEFDRFVSVGGPAVAAVDAVGRYVDPDGAVSVVSSADVYEFDAAGLVVTITSYAVELAAGS